MTILYRLSTIFAVVKTGFENIYKSPTSVAVVKTGLSNFYRPSTGFAALKNWIAEPLQGFNSLTKLLQVSNWLLTILPVIKIWLGNIHRGSTSFAVVKTGFTINCMLFRVPSLHMLVLCNKFFGTSKCYYWANVIVKESFAKLHSSTLGLWWHPTTSQQFLIMWFFQHSICFSLTWGLHTFRKVGAKNAAVEVRMNLGWFSNKLTCGKRKDHGHIHGMVYSS